MCFLQYAQTSTPCQNDVIVVSEGYVLSVLGPYRADKKKNDASIKKHLFKSNAKNLADLISDDDV